MHKTLFTVLAASLLLSGCIATYGSKDSTSKEGLRIPLKLDTQSTAN